MPSTAIISDSKVKAHDPGPGHPEQIARFNTVMDRLQSSGLLGQSNRIASRAATAADLALVHPESYIELVDREVLGNRRQLSTGDTAIGPGSVESARAAAGCALTAVDAVFTGKAVNAFCPVRPPGHHASAARGMGFCLFNTVAIAARYAQHKYGAERVAIIDWDVHHGNGTQDIFYQDPSVLFFSTHQSPWYPGTGAAGETGEGSGVGTTINAPFGAGAGKPQIIGAFTDLFAPAVERFHPDLILISAGFDSRLGDPLGKFTLTDADFRELTARTLELAARHCHERVVSVLEGGYSLAGLADGVEAHVRELLGVQ